MTAESCDREVWMPVRAFPQRYEVSNLGRIRNRSTGRVLRAVDGGHGYLIVTLCDQGARRNCRVHLVVLEAFCGTRPFETALACHNDGVKTNNRLVNLRWDTPHANQADRKRHGTKLQGQDVFGAILDDTKVIQIRRRIQLGVRNRPLAEAYGVSISTIHLIRHNRIWRHVA